MKILKQSFSQDYLFHEVKYGIIHLVPMRNSPKKLTFLTP